MRSSILVSTVILFCFFVVGCEKSISFRPQNQDALLVVDAAIETGLPPRVVLTRSLNYFSKIDADELTKSFIQDAEVVISNGTRTHRLQRYEETLSNGATLYFYSSNPSDLSTFFLGEENKSYQMTIQWEGKTYTARTTIPALTKTIDSLWWKPVVSNRDSTLAILMSRVTDPPGFGNYIRYFTKVNDGFFFPGIASVFDDQIVDGTTYDIQVDRGINRNETIDLEDFAFFNRGDTVTVKFSNIDKATFDFWRTVEFSYQSIGNPFSSPTRVTSNISNGALGYFGGYAVQYKSLVIPE